MTKRACIFVDGENFRHTIVELFTQFERSQYLPQRARWGDLFEWLVQQASPGAERVRTYWYVIQWLDFFPYKLRKLQSDSHKLQKVLSRHPPYKSELSKLQGLDLSRRMSEIVEGLEETRQAMQERFSGWIRIQDGISLRHPRIEFRRSGAICLNLFRNSFGPEKAVDVKLATDLIILRHIYDVAIIVSGDQDYVPAVQVVKNEGKTVINVVFKTRGGRLLPGGARRLNQETDASLEIPYGDFARFLEVGAER